ncbi:hypothetical protein QU617_12895 [Pseudomonas guariconensis]|uniref:hypothetical protein n=1 Tax=Pseudomonas guariconensis TaxID=1288410 RepID=UPI0025A95245|nr:hypothetical protein [Pseudomonas guariconensis]MDM9594209.1 hypothetical protein [Pseudomonas guariconensis]MDM9607039.1 hypothetical protein [Pseudomonas guariconensis]MDM9611995.1 hypothetical protein [Pseudomonas guariconensis]
MAGKTKALMLERGIALSDERWQLCCELASGYAKRLRSPGISRADLYNNRLKYNKKSHDRHFHCLICHIHHHKM